MLFSKKCFLVQIIGKITQNNNTKIKRETDRKTDLCSRCTDCGFKKIGTIDKEELSDLLTKFKLYIK